MNGHSGPFPEEEEWYPTKYKNTYVSEAGHVAYYGEEGVLKYRNELDSSVGYPRVSIAHETVIPVHRLVAETLLECKKTNGRDQVNHKDGDKTNNNLENLEWCTRSENMQHASRTGLLHPTHMVPIRIIETGEVFDSITECANFIGSSERNISNCLSEKSPRKRAKGYTFERVKKEGDND